MSRSTRGKKNVKKNNGQKSKTFLKLVLFLTSRIELELKTLDLLVQKHFQDFDVRIC